MVVGVHARHLLLTLGLLLAAPSRAATPLPGGIVDLVGTRTLGLGAATGVMSGNDGLFVNPAAIGARRRYSIEGLFLVERRGATTTGQYLGASVVDSLSTPVAASFAWARSMEGAQSGNLFIGGLAGTLAERLYLGAQLRYYDLSETTPVAGGTERREKIQAVTADAGLFWEVSEYITLGGAGFNLIPTGHEQLAPKTVAAGLAIGSDTSFKLSIDWRADLERRGKTTNRYAAGLEVLLGDMVPLRGGYLIDETLDSDWWCAGAGLVTPDGVGLDVGYRQALGNADARVLSVTLKVQFLNM